MDNHRRCLSWDRELNANVLQIAEDTAKSEAFLQEPGDTERIGQSQRRKASIDRRRGDKGVVAVDVDRIVAEDIQLRKVHWVAAGTGYWDCCVPSPAINSKCREPEKCGVSDMCSVLC